MTRVQAGPPKWDCQLLGGSSPSGPLPSRKMNMSRSGLPAGAARACLEGGVLVRAVVGNQVHNDPQAQAVGLGHHDVEVAQGAEDRVHVAVVADVVAGVALRRPVERGQPDGVHVQVGQVRQLLR